MPATITEPLLVTREQLDAAIAVVERTARDAGLVIRIEAAIYIDPEIASEPPVELLTVVLPMRPAGGHQAVHDFLIGVKSALRSEGLYYPELPLVTHIWPSW